MAKISTRISMPLRCIPRRKVKLYLHIVSEPIFKFLKREADILKKMINTPYVVQIKNSSEIDDIFYIILELCDESLKNLVLS